MTYSGVNAGVSEGGGDADAAKHDRMVELVDEMLDLHRRLAAAWSDADRTRLERAIVGTDLYGLSGQREPTAFHLSLTPDLRSGGQAVKACPYTRLYGLTEEEIKVVVGAD